MSKNYTSQQKTQDGFKTIEEADAEILKLQNQMTAIHKNILGIFHHLGENDLLPDDNKDPAYLGYLNYLVKLNKLAVEEGKNSFIPEAIVQPITRTKSK